MKRLPIALTVLAGLAAGCTPKAPAPPAPTPVAASAAPEGICLRDTADAAGLRYAWTPPGKPPLNILQTIGNGAALLDADGDGNLDALLVGPSPALFKGDGKGAFSDISQASGIGKLKGHFLGVAVGDIDNDGDPDVYLSGYREGRLLRNDAGRFTDITPASGLKPQPWGTSAAFADVDADGFLDLYVANYAVFGPKTQPQFCLAHGMRTSCGPREYQPEKGVLLLGNGRGAFRDVTAAWGAGKISGKTLGVAFADLDGSGRPSLTLANDEMPGDLLHNVGGRFDSIASVAGTAYDSQGGLHGGMGTDWGDYDNDGRLDIFVATFQNEVKNIYHNDGELLFTDRGIALNLAAATPMVTFGSKWLDFDNDGWLDLAIANGHVQDNIEKIDSSTRFRQPTQLFRNTGGTGFEDASARIDDSGRRPVVGRGLATGDIDNDGRVDILVVDSFGKPVLLKNETPGANHWIGLRLSQPGGGVRDATGALVTVVAGGKTQVRHVHTDGSYLSASDPRVHVGLGSAARVDSVSVRWPDGHTETFPGLSVDRYWSIERGGARK